MLANVNYRMPTTTLSLSILCAYLGTVETEGLIETEGFSDGRKLGNNELDGASDGSFEIEGFSDGRKLGETEVEGLSEGCSESVGCSLGDVDIDG